MWYLSGNRDEDMFENADDLVIERTTRATTSPSASGFTAASVCASPNCSCGSCGRKSCNASSDRGRRRAEADLLEFRPWLRHATSADFRDT